MAAAAPAEQEEGSFSLFLVMDLSMSMRSIPTSEAHGFLKFYKPEPLLRNPSSACDHLRLRIFRSHSLRRLESHIADPSQLSAQALTTIKQLHSPLHPNPIAPELLLTLAAYLTSSSSSDDEFSKSFHEVFEEEIKPILDNAPQAKGLISDDMRFVYHTFSLASTTHPRSSERDTLRIHWGRVDRVAGLLKEYVEIEWERMGPPVLQEFADVVSGENAVEYWKQADAASRENLSIIVGSSRASQILEKVDAAAAANIVVDVPDSIEPPSKKEEEENSSHLHHKEEETQTHGASNSMEME